MNPPFGTKGNEDILKVFLEKAIEMTQNSQIGQIYILHKESFHGINKIISQIAPERKIEKIANFQYEIKDVNFDYESMKEFKKIANKGKSRNF